MGADMKVRRDILLAALMLVAACGASNAQGIGDNAGTVPGVGVLPAGSINDSFITTSTSSPPTTTPLPGSQVGKLVPGNRVIIIGDSIIASTSSRYGRNMCDALVPLGWQVQVEAETGRFIEFGNEVLKQQLDAGWDAAVVFLGTNFSAGKIEHFRTELDKIVRQLSPRPVVLLTVTDDRLDRQAVNEAIRSMAVTYPSVIVLDWGKTSAETPGVLSKDGIHLSDEGRAVLATNVAFVLGEAPVQPGKCLASAFTDDSAGNVNGVGSATTVPRRPPTTTTVKPTTSTNPAATSTTVKPVTSTSVAPTTTAPTATVAPTTVAQTAPTTAPTLPPTEP